MAKLSTIQYFPTVDAIKQHFHCLLPKPHDWRLLSPVYVGQINGLPNSHGKAIASNGILIAIEQGADQLFIGHMDSFVVDDEQLPAAEGAITPSANKKISTKSKTKVNIEEFI